MAPDRTDLARSFSLWLPPHFEGGLRYGRNQFIPAAATNWATQALVAAARARS